MALLDCWPSERRERQDPATGTLIWQMTAHPADHHPLSGADSSFTPTGDALLFTSDRGGPDPELFHLDMTSGEITQLTDTDRLNADQITPAADGRRAIAALTIQNEEGEVIAIDLETGESETLAVFLDARLDGCHLSASGEYVVTTVIQADETTITAVHTEGMRTVPILDTPGARGARFSPDSKNSVLYVRPSPFSLHCVEFDGTHDRLLFPTGGGDLADVEQPPIQNPESTLPIRPSWLGSGEEILFAAGIPGPLLAVPREGGRPRVLSSLPVCGARSSPGGDWIVAVAGEGTGAGALPAGAQLVLLDLRSGDARPLASLRGTEAFPLFSPDGRSVLYADLDDDGHSQLFIAFPGSPQPTGEPSADRKSDKRTGTGGADR